MFSLDQFVADSVTCRPQSMFLEDIEANRDLLSREIQGRSLCVIGGAGSIGSSFIRSVLPFRPASLVVVDLSENGLAELVRDVRATWGLFVPEAFRCYAVSYADPIFARIFRQERGFDIVANFSAHKHVRSEKDRFSVQALLENNDLRARMLMELLREYPPRHFFCVSTDKAANPVNIMGASKRIMEDLVMAYSPFFKVTTARFANVAFSSGSLPDGWLHRLARRQALAAPTDVRRYFVSMEESGQICMLACILGKGGETFFPKLRAEQMLTFSHILDALLRAMGLEKAVCESEEEARRRSAEDSGACPVFYSRSDTTGEKPFEEFHVEGERLDLDRFRSLGVILPSRRRSLEEVGGFLARLEEIFRNEDFTKAQVVEAIRDFIPGFSHQETGRSLDGKM